MDVTGAVISITSEQPERLGAWYRDVLALPRAEEMGDWAFRAGPLELSIDGRSETKGKTPSRAVCS